ncbi:hypothetical protein DPMN_009572 [Dreissena polymorpha]|uniref:Integrase zinc-binding domain-containing protein n=1 Tax=Dreissena polymorpha TaxID=45954 RepID=A0A9D4MX71_DREPO|nr:hypothetical protein DPMN_009572 [Dreissena polymorpha]
MLERLHKAHLGYDNMDSRVRGTIFRPGMRAELKEFTKNCEQCEDRKPSPQQEKLKQQLWNTTLGQGRFGLVPNTEQIMSRRRRLQHQLHRGGSSDSSN